MFRDLRQAEVEHLHDAVFPDHDVLGFDIPMNNSGGMRRCQCRRHLHADIQHFPQLLPSSTHSLTQALAVNELSRDERPAVLSPDLVNSQDVGMIET
jgi:hypothetical protein